MRQKAKGLRSHYVTLTEEGPAVANGDGGYTNVPVDLSPRAAWASIEPAAPRTLERVVSDTVASSATHVLTMPYHPQVSVNTIITWESRTFKVTGVTDPDMKHRETIAVCVEQV